MAKTYLERYGLDAIKAHLRRRSRRYFKVYADYANAGVCLFNSTQFAWDLGISPVDFPFKKADQNGWNLEQPPTEAEIDEFLLNSRTSKEMN